MAKKKKTPYTSLQDVARIRVKKKKDTKPDAPRIKKPENEQKDIFEQAMEGVTPLNKRGRDVPGPRQRKKNRPIRSPSEEKILKDIVKGNIEFDTEFTEEYLQAHIKNLSPSVFLKLKRGDYSPEAHIDLHGLNSEQAYSLLVEFIKNHYLMGKRCVLVITGRGKNSPLGLSVLKREIQSWLTSNPLRRVVLAFCTALPKDGGAGAIYVLLRKFKKNKGKVYWDKGSLDKNF